MKIILWALFPIIAVWLMAGVPYSLDLTTSIHNWYSLPLVLTYVFTFAFSLTLAVYKIVNLLTK